MKANYNLDVCQSLLRSRFSSAGVIEERRHLWLLLCLVFCFLGFFSLVFVMFWGFFCVFWVFGGASEVGHWVGMLVTYGYLFPDILKKVAAAKFGVSSPDLGVEDFRESHWQLLPGTHQ